MRIHGGKIFYIVIGVGIVADRFFKTLVERARYTPPTHIGWRYLAFEQFHNYGVAFSIPIQVEVVVPLTLIFFIALGAWLIHQKNRSGMLVASCTALFLGALSNAADRMMFHYTIDYLRIIDGIINIADILIIIGIVGIALETRALHKHHSP